MIHILLIAISLKILAPWQANDTKNLITDNSKKKWSLYSNTVSGGCPSTCKVHLDNTYTFHANGDFELDHGTITEDPQCEDCCNDLVNLSGKWAFTKGKKGVRVVAVQEKGNGVKSLNVVLLDGTFEFLEQRTMRVRQTDRDTNSTYVIEFRSK